MQQAPKVHKWLRAGWGLQFFVVTIVGAAAALLSTAYVDVYGHGRFPVLALAALSTLSLAVGLWAVALLHSLKAAYLTFVAVLPLLNLFIVVPDIELTQVVGPVLVTPRTVWVFVFVAIVSALYLLRRVQKPSPPRWLLLGIGLLLSGCVISTIASADRIASLHVMIHGVLEPLVLGLITMTVLSDERDVLDLSFVVALSTVAGIGLALLNVGLPRPTFVLESDVALAHWRGRQIGTAWYSIVILEQVMAFVLPLTIAAAYCERTAMRRWLLGGCAVLLSVATLASFKRGGLLVLLVTSAGIAVWRDYRKMLAAVLLAGAVLVAYNWRLVNDAYYVASVAYEDSVERFSSHRTVLWANALAKVGTDGLTGIGLGQYLDEDFIRVAPNRFEFAAGLDSPHQFFLQVAVEAGVVALTGVVLLLGGALTQAARSLSSARGPVTVGLSRAFLLGLITFTFYAALVEAEFLRRDINTNMFLLWITVGAVCVVGRDDRGGRITQPQQYRQ